MMRQREVGTRLLIRLWEKMAGEEGFEPSFTGSEPAVLPLDYSPVLLTSSATDVRCHVHDVTQSKIRRFSGGVNGIIPLIVPQKTRKIGPQIQSLLSNPLYRLDSLCILSLAQPLLKYQAKELWPDNGPPCHFVIKDTDDANETILPVAPPTLRAFTPRSADETEVMMAPITLPESVTEVAPC